MYNIVLYTFLHTPPLLTVPNVPTLTLPLSLPLRPSPTILGHRPQSTQPAGPLPGGGIQRTEIPINLPQSNGVD